jgi:hypothetical protein
VATLGYLEAFPPSWGGDQYKQFYFLASFYLAQGMFQIGGETSGGVVTNTVVSVVW